MALGESDVALLRSLYGANEMRVEMPSVMSLLLREVLHPFYLFQILSITLWLIEQYWGYAIVILVAATGSAASTVHEVRVNARRLRDMAELRVPVRVQRPPPDGQGPPLLQEVCSVELVPGDLVLLEDRMLLPCDVQAVGVEASLIVNEAMLTGESVPVVKCGVLKCTDDVSESLLYGGTSIVQARPLGQCFGRVLTTGFNTAKGDLMRAILHGGSNPKAEEFYRQGFAVVGVLFCLALVGVFVNIYLLERCIFSDFDPVKKVADTLDVITIAVAPALPVALSIGIAFAMIRLRQAQIFCIAPPTINIAGRIQVACFDKTGTLTQDLLQLHSLLDTTGRAFPADIIPEVISTSHCMFLILAACHALMLLEDGAEIVGDPLELAMFQSLSSADSKHPIRIVLSDRSNSTIVIREGGPFPFQIEILHRFPFASKLQRMSCIVRVNNSRDFVLLKGSPEVILDEFCSGQSSPASLDRSWTNYTKSGYRVLSCAVRSLDSESFSAQYEADHAETALILAPDNPNSREMAEKPQGFLYCGSLVFENPLKPESEQTIAELKNNAIRPVMITGDHPLTALHVARQCHFVAPHPQLAYLCTTSALDFHPIHLTSNSQFQQEQQEQEQQQQQHQQHQQQQLSLSEMLTQLAQEDTQDETKQTCLAMTGPAFSQLMSEDLAPEDRDLFLARCAIYARMKPDQKAALVAHYQQQFRTAMTGDGSNDCGALKQADVGLSLSSEAEATMAAPFTSASPSPLSLITLLREGRAALVTSFACFRYIVFYSMIQFFSIEILYFFCATYGNWHYLIQDLLAVFPLAIVMSRTEAATNLCPLRPPGVLFSFKPVLSLLFQCSLIVLTQLAGIFLLQSTPGYVPTLVEGGDLPYNTDETFFLQHLAMIQYILVCFALSIGAPYRKPFWTNHWLSGLLLFLSCIELWFMFAQPASIVTFFDFKIVPTAIPLLALTVGIFYGAIAFVFEYWLIQTTWDPLKSCVHPHEHSCIYPTHCCEKKYETLS